MLFRRIDGRTDDGDETSEAPPIILVNGKVCRVI
jgi:hypothetical protein